jgi:hypothetical protein
MSEVCKHEDCFCKVPEDRSDGHCSDYCKQHGAGDAHERHECSCGHSDCRPASRSDG